MNGSSSQLSNGRSARGEMTRRRNLSTVLKLLNHGSQPRSQLTARTGLNRSTVAALVAELAELGLAYESDPDPTRQVGRPSPMVHADPRAVAIAVNPEVDAITIGVVGLDGRVIKRIRYETEGAPSVREFIKLSSAIIEGVKGEFEASGMVVGIGVAVPGLVRARDGLVRLAPHLEWRDEPVTRLLSEATGYPVSTGNDASLGALAEHIYGAGRGISDFIYLNGGASGIGGGIITNGVPVTGKAGYAGEFGHVRVDSSAPLAGSPDPGSLECQVNRADLLRVLGLVTADADTLDAALLASTDPAVGALVRRQLESLSTSLRNAVNVLNPEVIVLGGFLASVFAADPEFLVEQVRIQSLEGPFEDVSITPAQLGSDLLMIGAAELAFASLLADPAAVGSRKAASAV